LKVNVVLIPNVYFETPNYSINRLRHDDMKLGEVQASYQRVEKPAQEAILPAAGPEARPARQQAAVRGITPSQPAPIREQKPLQQAEPPSFLDRIFGWFKQMGGEEKVREQPPTLATRPERARPRRDRPARAERSVEATGTPAQAAETPKRPERRSEPKLQSERTAQKKQSRPPREEKIKAETRLPAIEEQPGAEEIPQQEESSRRRRRGGRQRDRGDRPERASRENKQTAAKYAHAQQATGQPADQERIAESAAPEFVPESMPESMPLIPETSALILTSSTPAVEAPPRSDAVIHAHSHPESLPAHEAPPLTPVRATVSQSEETPGDTRHAQSAMTETAPETSVLPFPTTTASEMEIPQTEIPERDQEAWKSTSHLAAPGQEREAGKTGETAETREAKEAESSVIEFPDLVANGLIMVETIPEKIKQGETGAEAESTLPQRRRKRPQPVPLSTRDEPMVQIETHK
jgi:ribonuclease E